MKKSCCKNSLVFYTVRQVEAEMLHVLSCRADLLSMVEPGWRGEERVVRLVSWDPEAPGENPEKETGPRKGQSRLT
jgi:hypothetical protein